MPDKKISLILILIVGMPFMFKCALLSQKNIEITDVQKENDLIELLNSQQVEPVEAEEEFDIDKLRMQVAELEKGMTVIEEENNMLKSDNLVKDERIWQLESVIQVAAGKTTTETLISKPTTPREKTSRTGPLSEFEIDYQGALNTFKSRQYRNALSNFSNLLVKNRNHSLSDNCQYWMGECYFALKEYEQAIIAFEKVFTFLNSNKDADAQFKLGYTYYRMGDMNRAQEEFHKLITNYSESEYVLRAQSFLEKME